MKETYATGIYGSSMIIPDPYLIPSSECATIHGMTNIAHYRKLRGLSQEQLAQMVGVKQPHISRIEKGDDGPPLRLFKDLAEALGVSLADLFSEKMDQASLILVDAFRAAGPQGQRMMLGMAQEAKDQPEQGGQSAT